MKRLADTIRSLRPPKVILVGDAISRSAKYHGIHADLRVIDCKEMRRPIKGHIFKSKRIFRASNQPGTIEEGAWMSIQEAINAEDALVIVNGEEDLLTLVAISIAPLGAIVAYGQPNEGIVIVRVNRQKKEEIERLISMMVRED
jgi:uncharacterized protein (UPF0218 family)